MTLESDNLIKINITPLQSLNLKRNAYNKTDPDNLQAWDSADEYLLNHLADEKNSHLATGILIFNDTFGALTTALYAYNPTHVGDSFVSQQVTKNNLKQNHFDPDAIAFLSGFEKLPSEPGLVIIKIPKTLSQLESQLHQIRHVATEHTIILASAKAKDIHTSTLELFETILGVTTTSLAWKKSRLVFCTVSKEKLAKNTQQPYQFPVLTWKANDSLTISNHANVFARTGLDIGARLFMQHLPRDIEGTIVDLGCGNGVIGLTALTQNPQAKVIFIDESFMAIESSRMNVMQNFPNDIDRSLFIAMDAMYQFEPNSVTSILCNPPFHQNQTLTDDIAWRMFVTAKQSLHIGGELRVIGNRHLNYFHKLKKLFGNCENIGSNPKFSVFKAIKQS
ncbi:methyltransferase [Thorsellia anophelis]|uniref:Ribosomal RNA large subunit methyltransferase G n=1 Tax=Thorsellia anophelis DSM 18579 TaxID=1123402 RepID=A0A1I0EVQ7_9GAMM|nr:methyltransferase [Thorsellia anophelis]SET49517.1 23S rRNA (guanine1835-N2)-methyltransferase [Thorsellia anophelis DSM 18579]